MQWFSECGCCFIVIITITGSKWGSSGYTLLLGIKLEAGGPVSPVGDSGSCDGLNHRADHCRLEAACSDEPPKLTSGTSLQKQKQEKLGHD